MKRKVFATIMILTIAAVCVFSTQATAFAEKKCDMKATVQVAQAGDVVKAVCKLTATPEVKAVRFIVSYDADALMLVSCQKGDALTPLEYTDNYGAESGPFWVLYDGLAGSDVTGTLFTITFNVKERAINGNYKIALNVLEYYQGANDSDDTKFFEEDNVLDAISSGVKGIELAGDVCTVTNHVRPDEPLKVGLVIGLAVGGAAVIAGIGVVAYFVRRKKSAEKQ